MAAYPLLLQAAEATKAAADAAGTVAHHAGGDPFTALLWLLVLVFGGAAVVLLYKLVWKKETPTSLNPISAEELATLQFDVARVLATQKKIGGILNELTDIVESVYDVQQQVNATDRTVRSVKTLISEEESSRREADDKILEALRACTAHIRKIQAALDGKPL